MSSDPDGVGDDAVEYAAAVLNAHPEPLAILVDELRVRAANGAFLDLVSLDVEQATGRSLGELGMSFPDDPDIEEALANVLATGAPMQEQRVSISTPGQGRRTLALTAHRIELAGNAHDSVLLALTRRARWQPGRQRHRHNVALLKSISASTRDVILTLSDDGVLETASTSIETMLGYTPAEAVGLDLGALICRTGDGEKVSRVKDALKSGPSIGSLSGPAEFIGVRRDGSRIPVEVSISEIDDESRFTCMIRDVSDRKRLEQQVLDISTEEQRRIGLELHDDTLQAFTGMQLVAEELMEILPAGSHEHELACTLAENNSAASRRARLLARGLIPARIPAGGLITALEALASDIGEVHAVTIGVEHDDFAPDFPDGDVATHVYRIVQEAASNAARHSGADEVRISVSQEAQRLVVRIEDSGTGIEAGTRDGERGLGLKIMAYRADLIGAELSIENWRGGGTAVVLSVPYFRWDADTADLGATPRPDV